jgi:hypothetical protein
LEEILIQGMKSLLRSLCSERKKSLAHVCVCGSVCVCGGGGERDTAETGLVNVLTFTSVLETCLVLNMGCPKKLLAFPPCFRRTSST